MRIILLADTHGYLEPRIEAQLPGADLIIHAGDVGTGVADHLAGLTDWLVLVAGNNDPSSSPWPLSAVCDLPGGRLAVIHGHQWPARNRHRRLAAVFADKQAVVYGHSHRRVLCQAGQPWIINPGAAGKTRAYGGPSYMELLANEQRWQVKTQVFMPRRARSRRRSD